MSRIPTPDIIFKNVLEKKISRNEALKLLESIINESNDPDIRVNVIEVLEKLSLYNETVYSILEKALISDESDLVRFIAARALIKYYKITENTPLLFALENENSVYVLRNLLQVCLTSDKLILKQLQETILTRISNFYNLNPDDANFIMDIDYLDYIKFRENINEFSDKFQVNEHEKQDILRDKAKLGYKGLGRVVKSQNGFILGLKLHDFNEIPNSIQKLHKLEYLEIKRSDLRNFDNNFENLNGLKYLVLSNNEIDLVPKWIIEVAQRRDYAVKYIKNGVNFHEANVLGLLEILLNQALILLDEHETFNPSLLHHFKINRNGNVIGINISSDINKLGLFPRKLCSLEYLRELYLPNQNIKKLPECIAKLKVLEILDLRDNNLIELPKGLYKIKNLKQLKINGNKVRNNK
jgi:Leucine-rich repeat (LRR) protein